MRISILVGLFLVAAFVASAQYGGSGYGSVGVQLVTDTNTLATAGTLRYYVDGTNSYIEVGMKTGTNTVEWVEIMKKSWSAE